MLLRDVNKITERARGEKSESLLLMKFYRKLAEELEHLESVYQQNDNISWRTCAAILLDDIKDLLDECENYVFLLLSQSEMDVLSFLDRSETVLEEVDELNRLRMRFPN